MSVPKLTILSLFLKHVGDSMKSKKTSFLFNSRNKDESKMEASTQESGFPGRRSRYTHTRHGQASIGSDLLLVPVNMATTCQRVSPRFSPPVEQMLPNFQKTCFPKNKVAKMRSGDTCCEN